MSIIIAMMTSAAMIVMMITMMTVRMMSDDYDGDYVDGDHAYDVDDDVSDVVDDNDVGAFFVIDTMLDCCSLWPHMEAGFRSWEKGNLLDSAHSALTESMV